MFIPVKTTNMLLKYFGVKDAVGLSTAIDGRCTFLDLSCKVIESIKEEAAGGKGGRPKEIPSVVELSVSNTDVTFRNVKGANMARAVLELSRAIYALGEVAPFGRIMEPMQDESFPKIVVKLKEGKLPSKEVLEKGLRVYVTEA